MRGRRMGRPGLVGTMARTAVIAGTATAVSGNVQRSQAAKHADQQELAAAREQQRAAEAARAAQAAAQAPPAHPVPAPAPAASSSDAMMAQLVQLGEMRTQGLLSDEEFAAAKARLLSS